MIDLEAGSARLAIDPERGGRFASLMVDGRELLRGPPDETDRGIRWGCYVMAPWAGRIAGAVLEWNGRRHQLPVGLAPNAIHGYGYDRVWRSEGVSGSETALTLTLAEAGWPFGGAVRHHVALSDDALVADLEITADRAAPVTAGWHPWFARRGSDVRVRVQAAETLEVDELIPTGRRRPVDEATDLRGGPLLGDRRVDVVYPDAASPAVITWPDLELSIEFADPLETLVVYTPPEAFCVEPQSGWPNAPGLAARGVQGTGLQVVEPGRPFEARMTWRWRSTSPG